MFGQVAIVAILGAVGVTLRFFLLQYLPVTPIPLAILISNSVGSFAAGLLLSYRPFGVSELTTGLIVAGLLGGLTTFSSMASDSMRLFSQGHAGLGLLNILLNNVLAIGLCFGGILIGRTFTN